ncbi:Tetracenomycin polyketide synthesis O-methyltransferase TcmP [Colletotrichum sidae]|uniref:Tetracenomycin polyketide synthesis O-methyltransferase TcmP n=1 Tax=Colletotrichum sidae TaxID=1347389 RepID=A0A4R8RSZ5_9PEZI|nr:Tetracenomycin polyketide synthesis O-methyltransferase TcmP [Colletotrichum sidae]
MSATSVVTTQMSKGKVKLSGAQETLLLTLFARAKDAESPNPILHDQYALEIVNLIRDQGYDFDRTSPGLLDQRSFSAPVAVRGRMLDICTEKFLQRHKGPATVLHLACGMDSRCHRVKWQGEGRVWIDCDREEVVELRRQVMRDPDVGGGAGGKGGAGGEYRLIHPDIHDDDWLRDAGIPTDRPVLVVFEGLTMYLTRDEMYGLAQRIVNFFRRHGVRGEMRFDAIGSVAYYGINYVLNAPFKRMGTRFHWCMDDPRTLEKNVSGLKFKDRIFWTPELFRFGAIGLILGFLTWFVDLFAMAGILGAGYGYEF